MGFHRSRTARHWHERERFIGLQGDERVAWAREFYGDETLAWVKVVKGDETLAWVKQVMGFCKAIMLQLYVTTRYKQVHIATTYCNYTITTTYYS